LDIGGYLGMPIPTIKHNNLSGYERIPTCKSCNLKNLHHQLQRYRILISLETYEEGKKIKKNCKHRDTTKFTATSRIIFLSPPVFFPNLSFHVKSICMFIVLMVVPPPF